MTPLLMKILDSILFTFDSKPKVLAFGIYNAVRNKVLPLGSLLPPYRVVAAYLKLDPNIVLDAWKDLRDDYKIIITSGKGGTRIVSAFPGELTPYQKLGTLPQTDTYRVYLERKTIVESKTGSTEMRSLYNKHKNIFGNLTAQELKERNDLELLPAFKSLMNHSLATPFTSTQIFYMQDYELLFKCLCMVLVTGKRKFVMSRPSSTAIEKIVEYAGKEIVIVASKGLAIFMDDLERICKEDRVAVVYIGADILLSKYQFPDSKGMKKLMELQKTFKFMIVVDDRFPGLSKIADSLKPHITGNKSAFVYIRPLTIIHSELNSINIIAAPKRIVALLEKKLRGIILVDPLKGAVGSYLLTQRFLSRQEIKIFKAIAVFQKMARKELLSSGLWQEKYIDHNIGWQFYLVPVNKALPDDIFQRLSQSKIFTIDPASYNIGSTNNKGIVISIAYYLNDKILTKDLGKLHHYIMNND